MNSKRNDISDEECLTAVVYFASGIALFILFCMSSLQLNRNRYSEQSIQSEKDSVIREQKELDRKKSEILNLIIRLSMASIDPPYLPIFQVETHD